MKSSVTLGIEQLESRDTPSGTPFAGNAFLPPGIASAVGDPHVPAPAHVGRDGSIRFLPPGIVTGVGDPHGPIPVTVNRDGSVSFLPPGATHGFDPQPDPPAV
jgi:hypothetical protein